MTGPGSRLVCAGCGAALDPDDPRPFRCPNAAADEEHVLVLRLDREDAGWPSGSPVPDESPFVRYRELGHAWRFARRQGVADADFVATVRGLDRAIAGVAGGGFRVTPLCASPELARALGVARVWVKDETANVTGTHKGRHLFGLALWLAVLAQVRQPLRGGLAIASCGNAALAAAVVARAAGRDLTIFVPPDASPAVLERLRALGATIEVCVRDGAERGDPCLLGFREAVAGGALPFSVQGPENALAVEGGRTLAWEMADQLRAAGARAPDRLFVPTGGGALASACQQGFETARALGAIDSLPRLHPVQTTGAHPLERAWLRLARDLCERLVARGVTEPPPAVGDDADAPALAEWIAGRSTDADRRAVLAAAARHRSAYMWPWETEPASVARAILDDETYDWLEVAEGMLATGGWPVVVNDERLHAARSIARTATGRPVSHTGAAGLAGAQELAERGLLDPGEELAVLFTGADR